MQCYRGAIIRLEVAWRNRLACAGEAACRPAVECYRPRQTTTDAREQNNTAPTLCRPIGEPVINGFPVLMVDRVYDKFGYPSFIGCWDIVRKNKQTTPVWVMTIHEIDLIDKWIVTTVCTTWAKSLICSITNNLIIRPFVWPGAWLRANGQTDGQAKIARVCSHFFFIPIP